MWFPTHKKVQAALDEIIRSLKHSDERLIVWEERPRFLPDEGLNQTLSTVRDVLDDALGPTTEISLSLTFGQVTARQIAPNLAASRRLAEQISEKLDELDAGAAAGSALFEKQFGISNAQN